MAFNPVRGLSKALSIPRYLKTPLLLSFLISSISALLVLVSLFTLQPVVPIWYTLSQVGQQLAPKEWLFVFPLFSFSMTIFHFGLVSRMKHYGQLMIVLMSWTTLVLQFVLLCALLRILWIVS